MVEFTHYFIYGNPPEGFTMEKMEEWLKVPKKMNMEVVYYGVSIGTAEDFLIVLKGKVTDFEKCRIPSFLTTVKSSLLLGAIFPTSCDVQME